MRGGGGADNVAHTCVFPGWVDQAALRVGAVILRACLALRAIFRFS